MKKKVMGFALAIATATKLVGEANAAPLSPKLSYTPYQFAVCQPVLMAGSFADEKKTRPFEKGRVKGNVVLTAKKGYVIDPRPGSYVFDTKTIGIDKSGSPTITQRVGIGLPKQITLNGYSYRGSSPRIRTVSLEAFMAAYQIKGTFECYEALNLSGA